MGNTSAMAMILRNSTISDAGMWSDSRRTEVVITVKQRMLMTIHREPRVVLVSATGGETPKDKGRRRRGRFQMRQGCLYWVP